MHLLRQRRLFVRQEFGLTATGLRVGTYSWKEGHERVLPYEELGMKREYRLRPTNWLALTSFLCFFAVGFGLLVSEMPVNGEPPVPLFWLATACLAGLVALTLSLYTRRHSLVLTGGHYALELRLDRASRQQVEAFAHALQERIRQRHLHNFMAEETLYTADYRLNRLRWLRQIGAVSDAQFRRLVRRSEKLGVPKKHPKSAAIGFDFSVN
jgi:hypothetical protein